MINGRIYEDAESGKLKVLLVGDFSGVHLFLKLGLESLGHDVSLLDYGCRWGKLNGIKNKTFRKLLWKYATARRMMEGILGSSRRYDVVQFINPFVYSGTSIGRAVAASVLRAGKRRFLLACGCDSYFYNAVNSGDLPDRELCVKCMQIDKNGAPCQFSSDSYRTFNRNMVDDVDGIIPLIGTYSIGYRNFSKTSGVIDFPVLVTDKNLRVKRSETGKIRIFHANSSGRQGFKGSNIIHKALNLVASKYGSQVEIIAMEQPIAFDQYLGFLSSIDVLIDQTYGWALGMNALLAMSQGVVVLTRFESDYVHPDNPALNIYGNIASIVEQCSLLIENRDELNRRANLGLQYVRKHHHYVNQAEKFLEQWRGIPE